MKRILLLIGIFITTNTFSQKTIEKPASTGITEVDQYVDKCFEFYSYAKKLNEKVQAIDVEISANKLTEQEMKSKKEELQNCMKEATAEQKKVEELLTKSADMPEKVKAGISNNPLKAAKAMKNLAKASEAVKQGGVENLECIKSIPTVLEKIKN